MDRDQEHNSMKDVEGTEQKNSEEKQDNDVEEIAKRVQKSRVSRRKFLKLMGATVVGATVGVSMMPEVHAANVGPNWEVKNRYIQTGGNQLGIGCAVTDPNGEGLIEHVYIKSTASSDKPAIWVNPRKHRGHLIIKNVHIEGHADNAIYSENAPPHGAGGKVTIEDCYLHDNTRGNLRINGNTEVRNTHIHNTGKNFPTRGYASAGQYSWYAGSDEITLQNCHIDMTGKNTKNGSSAFALKIGRPSRSSHPSMKVVNSQIRGDIINPKNKISLQNTGKNPEIAPPKGVPMTPEEAKSGESSATGDPWSGSSSSSSDSSPC